MKYTLEEVENIFLNNGIRLLSKKYKNNQQKLEYQCLKCSYIGTKALRNLLNTPVGYGCKKCSAIKNQNKCRYKIEEVKLLFKERNMQLLSTKYSNNDERLKYKCLNDECGYIGEKILGNLTSGSGCPECAKKKSKLLF
tara:strand:- start:9469 stop:9885 length:417 start_codon:yes stop_codon:yes gene_type:complete